MKFFSVFAALIILILSIALWPVVSNFNNDGGAKDGTIAGNNSDLNPISENFKSKVRITTVFDNYLYEKGLTTGYGFSCLVEIFGNGNQKILFDTGANGTILLSNFQAMKINNYDLDLIFLSHSHADHVGGLAKILELNSNLTVLMPSVFPRSIKTTVSAYKTGYQEITNQEKISDYVYTTGVMGVAIKEQSLILLNDRGLVVVTGCAHPGIVDIVKKAKTMFPEMNVYLVMGGFHLGGKNNRQIQEVVAEFRRMGVENVAPSHCTGDTARKLFKNEYGNSFWENGVGRIIKI